MWQAIVDALSRVLTGVAVYFAGKLKQQVEQNDTDAKARADSEANLVKLRNTDSVDDRLSKWLRKDK